VRNTEDRYEEVRVPIENLGGTIHAMFFTTGRYDVLVITEYPEGVSASSVAVAFASGGAVANIQSTPLLSATQAIESWRKTNSLATRAAHAETELAATAAGH